MKVKKVKDNLGYYFTCNNKYCIGNFSKYFEDIKNYLEVDIVPITINRSQYCGLFSKIIENCLIVPDLFPDEEKTVKDYGLEVIKINSKYNVLGNFILEYRDYLFVSPLLEDELTVLNKEIIKCKDELVGSKCIANSKGILVSPLLEEEDYNTMKEICNNIEITTLGFGNPFLSACVLMNDKGALIEQSSTALELSYFENVFL